MNERGSASLYGVALMAVLLTVCQALAWMGGVVVAHRRAQAAADLAALAGAAHPGSAHPGSACGAADSVARSNGAEVVSCRQESAEVWLEVRVRAPTLAGRRPTVTARAHAGPGP